GEVLGEASFAAMSAGARRVVRVDFDRASVVSAGPVWAAAQCDKGALLWLTNRPCDATPRSSVLRRAARALVCAALTAAADRGAGASFVTASGANGSDSLAGHPAFHGVRLYLGGVRLRGQLPVAGSAGDKETRFSVAPAVQPLTQSGTAGTLAAVSLSL